MPFGRSNAPATFSMLMEIAIRGFYWEHCMVCLDDVIIFQHDLGLENLDMDFNRLQSAGLKLKPKKCALFQSSVKFLGQVVSQEGVSFDLDKVTSVKDWKVPERSAQLPRLRSLLHAIHSEVCCNIYASKPANTKTVEL